ncbi:M20 family metallo-hydrolase [Fulvivirgaceae bacterium BMA10]|uniref:M20 family metallo-hydrolase n=1 Tax=Splendidivirga corallicola TaxID=3051826 RepID=A0ABT8KLJ1_9BACT|nr:M20 family metallo-hydrolase [Fulvivirgaceae bacterium BMA10]
MTAPHDIAISLLQQLIAIPSISREEHGTADLICDFFQSRNLRVERLHNNVWVKNEYFRSDKPTILLNSHHDTVKPNAGYSLDPFDSLIKADKLYGLGSNDAGGALVSLIMTFLYFNEIENLNYNLILAATAEEEISGSKGISSILPSLGDIDCAIVGEPTQMQMAIAEKGLMVLDCMAKGMSGHAARDEGENAIYKAMKDIEWFKTYNFERESDYLGPIKMSTTLIQSGSQHNVVPDTCNFTVDVRTTDAYSNEETLAIIRENVASEIKPRSTRLGPSFISNEHPLIKSGLKLDRETFGSVTLSDQALLRVPSLKMGPGDSARSHTADEYIYLSEIKEGIQIYIDMLKMVLT